MRAIIAVAIQPLQRPTLVTDIPFYVYQSIAQSVIDHGIDTMFGLMGDANLFMADDFVRSRGGKFVPVAIEGSAVLMALSHSLVSGKVGVATVTHGPALGNCFTALAEGAKGRTPMVLLAGDTPILERNALQSIDQRELVKATGAGFEQIRSVETTAHDIAHAFYRATIEKRPIVVNIPADFMWQNVQHQKIVNKVFQAPAMVQEGDDFDDALGMIASAKRPIILAGAGAIDAKESLVRLAERMEAPLATTLKAKNLFTGHPNNMDIFGTLSTPDAYEAIALSDCVIAFGAGLHSFTTDHGALLKGKRVVLVTDDLNIVGKSYRPDAALIADAGLTADNIIYWLDQAEIAPSGFVKELDQSTLAQHPKSTPEKAKDGFIDFRYALDRLEAALPKDRLLATDGGRFMTEIWCRISVPSPRKFVPGVEFGSIGVGMSNAIGMAHADPGKPVCLFTGDGGFMMGGLTEFNTAVRTGVDLITIVCNDAAYGAEHIQLKDRDMDPSLTEFNWPSFAETAIALGGAGITVQSIEDLELAIKAINTRDRPLLIELKLDANNMPRMRK